MIRFSFGLRNQRATLGEAVDSKLLPHEAFPRGFVPLTPSACPSWSCAWFAAPVLRPPSDVSDPKLGMISMSFILLLSRPKRPSHKASPTRVSSSSKSLSVFWLRSFSLFPEHRFPAKTFLCCVPFSATLELPPSSPSGCPVPSSWSWRLSWCPVPSVWGVPLSSVWFSAVFAWDEQFSRCPALSAWTLWISSAFWSPAV